MGSYLRMVGAGPAIEYSAGDAGATFTASAASATVYYTSQQAVARESSQVNASSNADGSIAPGASVTLYGQQWFYVDQTLDPIRNQHLTGDLLVSPLALVGSSEPLAQDTALPKSKLISDSNSAAVMSVPPVLGAKVTGLTTATEAANTTIVGSSRTAPNYASPLLDANYRITGPYGYLFGGTTQDVGAAQTTPPSGTPGPTGMLGVYEFELLNARKFEIWMRDVGVSQYCIFWISKDGGPFKPSTTADAPHTITSPGDGVYFLQPVDLGSVANWRIRIDAQTFTFGGVRVESTATLRYPQNPAKRALILGDSFATTANQSNLFISYVMEYTRRLGLLPHVSAVGGTGISAVAGDAANFKKYGDRVATDVTPYFSDEQPALILVQGSINDSLYGFGDGSTGSATFNTDADALFGALQLAYPQALLVTTKPMHTYRGDTSANALDAVVGAQISAIAITRAIPVYDAVIDIPLTGSGYQGHTTGSGNSDTFTFTDHQHPTFAGATAIGTGLANFTSKAATLTYRPYTQAAPKRAVNYAVPYRLIARHFQRWDAQAQIDAQIQVNGSASWGTATTGKGAFYIYLPDLAVPNMTTKFKLRLTVLTNDTAPGCTVSGYLALLSGGPSGAANAVNVGTTRSTVDTQITTGTLAADATSRTDGLDFVVSFSGLHALGLKVNTPGMAANSSLVSIVELWAHNV